MTVCRTLIYRSAGSGDADLGDVDARKHDEWNVAGVLGQAWNQRKRYAVAQRAAHSLNPTARY